MNFPNFEYENELWNQGLTLIAGCDEVGRGCLAGPVVTGVVVFKPETKIEVVINDSKKLSPKQRQESAEWIYDNALAYAIGVGSVSHINSKGIVSATNFAYRAAIRALESQLKLPVQFLLTDAFYISRVNKHKQKPIVGGDSQSISVAAASIIAKVYRDNLMRTLGQKKQFSNYLWHKNKGYGTKVHCNVISTYGITRYHRSLFVRNIIRNTIYDTRNTK